MHEKVSVGVYGSDVYDIVQNTPVLSLPATIIISHLLATTSNTHVEPSPSPEPRPSPQDLSYQDGDIVDSAAAEIGSDNRGRRLLEKMR